MTENVPIRPWKSHCCSAPAPAEESTILPDPKASPPRPPASKLSPKSTPFTPSHILGSPLKSLTPPYDPLATPSFRHSTPRYPSDQPWRFPSPSHPLHSTARDLSLASFIRGEATNTPGKGLDVSPIVLGPPDSKHRTLGSPSIPTSSKKRSFWQLNSFANRTPGFPKPSPRRLFSLPTPVDGRWIRRTTASVLPRAAAPAFSRLPLSLALTRPRLRHPFETAGCLSLSGLLAKIPLPTSIKHGLESRRRMQRKRAKLQTHCV
jgi:hypothetical protein